MSARLEEQGLEAHRILLRQKAAFLSDLTTSYEVRVDRLNRVLAMTERYADAVVCAINDDFGNRARQETQIADIAMVTMAAKHARRHLKQWMKPRRVPTTMPNRPGYNRILRQPLGVVGVVGTWNYPFYLALGPAVEALAAGNRVMIKPSELAPRLSALLQGMVAESFGEDEMAVVTGDAAVASSFVELPFDHLIFTGSGAVGRKVAQATARNLTPVTLELGGKSPVILDASCNLQMAAARIARAKLFNAGQTCIAPDYAFVPQDRRDELIRILFDNVAKMYPHWADNPDYTSIVNERHFNRLQALIDDAHAKGAQIVRLGQPGRATTSGRRMAPTLVLDVTDEMKIMQEEIFGPLLPIMTYQHLNEALHYINRHDRPLALYWFGEDRRNRDKVLCQTISGGVTINDCMMHAAQEEQPFGGVGPSGAGAYHGEHGFRTFSKEKPVFFQSRVNGLSLVTPPYGKTFDFMLRLLKRIG